MPLTAADATAFARLVLKSVAREYPNGLGHVLNGPADVRTPRDLHPAFYGCFDWHSAVHGHWLLVHLLRRFPGLPEAVEMRTALAANLTAANLCAEADYMAAPNRRSFERTYGWAWVLKLDQELAGWPDADGPAWHANLAPLTQAVVAGYLSFLPKQAYPIRAGVHPNTAFGLALALDWARATRHSALAELAARRSQDYYGADADYPARWEPGGDSFLSPALMEASLMSRVLPPGDFGAWLQAFLPGLAGGQDAGLLEPVLVADRTDPKLVHLDGLNLSRAWCLRAIAAALPPDAPERPVLTLSAERHLAASLPHVASGDYMGEHWLATFAVLALDA